MLTCTLKTVNAQPVILLTSQLIEENRDYQ